MLEAPMDDLAAIAVQVVRELPATPERGIVLVGISFGALLAFEVACLLANRGSPPLGLFVASQRAPSLAGEAHSWHTLDDERLIEKLVEIGGMEARDASDPEFQDLFLGAIRADLRASETYRPPPRRPLNFPIFVYRGSHDSVVSDEDCRAWQAETSSMVTLRTLEAGHFLTGEAGDLWLAALHADLEKVGVTSFFLT